MNAQWQRKNLSSCPKILDHYRASLALIGDNEVKGSTGERAAELWLKNLGIKYENLEKNLLKVKPKSLIDKGGKRPDFVAELAGETLYFDAKFHECVDDEFFLSEAELEKYAMWREWLLDERIDDGERIVVFLVFPHSQLTRKVWLITLPEIQAGETFTTDRNERARKVKLTTKDELSYDVSFDVI
jgi:hypothetical protein